MQPSAEPTPALDGEWWIYWTADDARTYLKRPSSQNRIEVWSDGETTWPQVSEDPFGLRVMRETGGFTLIPWTSVSRVAFVSTDELDLLEGNDNATIG